MYIKYVYFVVTKKCLTIWLNRWWGKIHWNITAWKRFLQPPKYGRYIWCRLHASKKSLWRFWNKSLAEYDDLYAQNDKLLLADVFTFQNICLEIYGLDPLCFLSVSGLAWKPALKKTNVKLNLLTDINMLLLVEKGIRGGMCYAIHLYVKANNKFMKTIMIKIKNLLILTIVT